MEYMNFAAIEIGSGEVSMKIYEVSSKKGIVTIDYIKKPHRIGLETYKSRHISKTSIENICEILNDYKRIMKEYDVKEYAVCTTSALREAENCALVLDRIKISTGLNVRILSNSEKRFLYYKSLIIDYRSFNKIVKKNTAIVDVSAGSIQISLYDKDTLVATQNLRLGFLRIKEAIDEFTEGTFKMYKIISDYISNDLENYKELYLKNKSIKNLIAIGDNITELAMVCKKNKENFVFRTDFEEFYKQLLHLSNEELDKEYGISREKAMVLLPIAMTYMKMFEISNADKIWFPDVTLHDGMVVNFFEHKEKTILPHDFTNDILLASRHVAKRYMCDEKHIDNVEKNALAIFDSLKSYHGLGKREKLWLQIAIILHGTGSYISINMVPMNSYNIIMSTEIIGLSHKEREIIACIVKYMFYDIPSFSLITNKLELKEYLAVAKLAAILRVADAMDKSHKQKFENISIQLKDTSLVITTDSLDDITLEKNLLNKRSSFFEEVFGITLKIKRKKNNK